MKISWYLISSGRLVEQPAPLGLPGPNAPQVGESWFDIQDAKPEELRKFLAPLDLHPVMIKRCLDSTNSPGVISYDRAVLLEFPAAINLEAVDPSYLTIILQAPLLVTIRTGPMPAIKELIDDLASEKMPSLVHLVQIVYLILDDLTDLSVKAETEVRDRILSMAKTMADNPGNANAGDLTKLRWEVDRLISLIENQLYCVTGLNASDNKELQESHRKAYIEDLVSEIEIAQRGIYRLEARMNSLF